MSSQHIPERTCALCRSKNEKKELFRLAKIDESHYIFDKEQKKQSRAIYICKNLACLGKLSKHNKLKIEPQEMLTMLNIVNKANKNYLNILSTMKNSGELVFVVNLLFENINKIHFIILAEDISKKNEEKLLKKIEELDIPFKRIGTMEDLGKIFNKTEVNVVGITDKKMARGLIDIV